VIVGSLLLILVAVTLLVLGLANGSNVLLINSIGASLLAAIALLVGARQAAAARAAESYLDPVDDGFAPVEVEVEDVPERDPAPTIPTQGGGRDGHHDADLRQQDLPGDEFDDEDPPDEPAPQSVPAADAALVARMAAEVVVIDGRPRYHLPTCLHLLGRESEPLPVGEAVTLGFTPCSLCEPDSALLAEARPV
jgi:hypothetical protein